MAHRVRLLAAFAAIYLIWGSTFLAIHVAVETIPPFLMAAARFVSAGAIVYAIGRWTGAPSPGRRDWTYTTAAGALMFLGGNGGLAWASQYVPSGLAALIMTLIPVWMTLLEWLWRGGARPHRVVLLGLALGFGGVALLIGPSALQGHGEVNLLGALAVVASSLLWSAGSIYARGTRLASPAILVTGMQMLGGGLLLLVASGLLGEFGRVQFTAVAPVAWLGLAYLIVMGAVVGHTAYFWLLKNANPSLVATYAFINPIVAVWLGWALAGEAVTGRMLVASAIIISAVALITLYSRRGRRQPRPVEGRPVVKGVQP
ncbi:MAG: EamA family transporter [Anaerolineae bacterium]|nr:EamA family transporter [Anaerolineae bacterium]